MRERSTTSESDLVKEVVDSVLAVKREPGHCSDVPSTMGSKENVWKTLGKGGKAFQPGLVEKVFHSLRGDAWAPSSGESPGIPRSSWEMN